MLNFISKATGLLCIVLISACASFFNLGESKSEVADQSVQSETVAVVETDAQDNEYLKQIDALQEQMKQAQLALLAPSTYQVAQGLLTNAQTQLANGEWRIAIETLSTAEAKINEADNIAIQNKQYFAELMAQHARIESIGSAKWAPSEYKNVNMQIIALMKVAESGNIEKALAIQPDIRQSMYELEATTMRNEYLNPVDAVLKRGEIIEAGYYAPINFRNAKVLIGQAEDYIDTHYRDKTGIEEKTNTALIAAELAIKTAEDVKSLFELNEFELETKVEEIKLALQSLSGNQAEQLEETLTILESIEYQKSLIMQASAEQAQILADTKAALAKAESLSNSSLAETETDDGAFAAGDDAFSSIESWAEDGSFNSFDDTTSNPISPQLEDLE